MGSGLVIGTTNWVLIQKKILSPAGKSIIVDPIPSGYSMLFVLASLNVVGAERPQMQFNSSGAAAYFQTDTTMQNPSVFSCVSGLATSFSMPNCDGEECISQIWINQKGSGLRNLILNGGHSTIQSILTGYWSNVNEVSKIEVKTTVNNMVENSFIAVYGVI
jgi:hypothetical protein